MNIFYFITWNIVFFNEKINFCFLLIVLLGIQSECQAQCSKSKVTEKIFYNPTKQGNDTVWINKTIYYYDTNGDLYRTENTDLNKSNYRKINEYKSIGDTIIIEKLIRNSALEAILEFSNNKPANSCKVRLAVNPDGDTLAYENTYQYFKYGIKNWDGIYNHYNIYSKYQMGSNSRQALFYRKKKMNGQWVVDNITIIHYNEYGDCIKEQNIQVAGYGYTDDYYKYKYDDCGNWIIRRYAQDKDKWYRQTIRTIEYHN